MDRFQPVRAGDARPGWGVFHRKSHIVSAKEAITWSLVWVSLSLIFNAGIYFFWDSLVPDSNYSNSEAAPAFLTGYLIEKSLSVDNIFIFVFIRTMPITERFEGDKFFIRRGGTLMATPLFLTLLIVESTDLVFAVDSISAIFAVTQDPFIVYTSNVFAILGLRALYFLLANIMAKFQYLKLGLSFVLAFIGIKMMLSDIYSLPVQVSLIVVANILTISVVVSLWKARTSTGKLKTTE